MPQVKEDQLIAEAYNTINPPVYHGLVSDGCTGAWTEFYVKDFEQIKNEFYRDDQMKRHDGELYYKSEGWEDDGVFFPIKFYYPEKFEECKKLLLDNKIVIFASDDDAIIHILGLDKKSVKKEILEASIVLGDWMNSDF